MKDSSRCNSWLTFVGFRTGADQDITHHEFNFKTTARCGPGQFRIRDNQFGKHRQWRHAFGQQQVPFAYLVAPIFDPPTGRAMLARNIGHRHPGHHAFQRDPSLLGLRAPPPSAWALDHLQPRNPNTLGGDQIDAHSSVSLQNQHLRHTAASRLRGSDQQ